MNARQVRVPQITHVLSERTAISPGASYRGSACFSLGVVSGPKNSIATVAMPFPDSQRVIYDRNPLEEVVCQVKFPPILKIDSAAPAAFQDEIRGTYPLLQEVPGILVDLPAEIMKM